LAVNGWNGASSGGTTDVVAREFIPLHGMIVAWYEGCMD